MTDLERVAAGAICVGFDGQHPGELDARLFDTPFAGYILFARNVRDVEQTRALTRALRGTGLPPVLAIDQEGGRVARLRAGVEEVPAMMAVAATGEHDLARRAGMQMGYDLRRAGLNLDFAPVLDLALFENNTVIGARSFGDDPARVADFAGAFADGLHRAGIVATFKHFPGHGSTAVDSHLDLPVIDLDEDVLRKRDLAPFEKLLADAPAVMTAHIVVNAFDRERAATTSRKVLTELLRDHCRFAGVCFTDCMQMDAMAKGIGSVAGSIEALKAGADCILVSHSIDLALEIAAAIARAIESGDLPHERLDEACARVRTLRETLQEYEGEPLAAQPPYPGIGREIGRRAVTVIRGSAQAEAASSIAVSFEGATVEGVQGLHTDHAAFDLPLSLLRLPLSPPREMTDAAIAELRSSGKRPIVLMRRAHIYQAQFEAVERIATEFPEALIVSLREPYDAFKLDVARNLACTYGDDAPSMQGLSDVVFGGAPAAGRVPLAVA